MYILAVPRLSADEQPANRRLPRNEGGASVLAVGYIIPLVYFIWSLKYGEVAENNPWGAVGLEWQTTSPPPLHNFEEIPTVDFEPYEYVETEPPERPYRYSRSEA